MKWAVAFGLSCRSRPAQPPAACVTTLNSIPRWVLLAAILAAPAPTFADDPSPAQSEGVSGAALSAAEPEAAVRLLPDWCGHQAWLEQHGLTYGVTYIGEVLANVSGGLRRGSTYEGLLKAQFDLDTDRAHLWSGGRVHASGLYAHGRGLTTGHLGDLFTLSNIDAPDTPRLFELWLEQGFGGDRWSVRVGQLAADEEFAGTDYGCLFINGTCGWPAIIALSAPAPVYPVGAPGARVALTMGDHWEFRTAAYAGAPETFDSSGRSLNPNGLQFPFDGGAFVIAETVAKWHQATNSSGLPGFMKIGGWYHTATFDHLRWDDTGRSLADPASSGVARSLEGNVGGYLALQQQVWRESPAEPPGGQGLGVFGRLGATPGDRNFITSYAEAGIHYRGLLPGRDADEFGIAIVHGHVGSAARNVARDWVASSGSTDPLPDHESILEAEYRLEVRPGWTIQGGIHAIFHPGGSSAVDDALVLSLRTTLDF